MDPEGSTVRWKAPLLPSRALAVDDQMRWELPPKKGLARVASLEDSLLLGGIGVAFRSDEADEDAPGFFRSPGLAVFVADLDDPLSRRWTHGDDHPSVIAVELADEARRNLSGGSGDEDGVVGCFVGKSEGAVCAVDLAVAIAEPSESFSPDFREGGNSLDPDGAFHDAPEEGGYVAGPGSDFKHRLPWFESQELEHHRDDVGLGNGLLMADGEGAVGVGFPKGGRGHEEVSGNGVEGSEDGLVTNAPGAELVLHHPVAKSVGAIGSKPEHERDVPGLRRMDGGTFPQLRVSLLCQSVLRSRSWSSIEVWPRKELRIGTKRIEKGRRSRRLS